MPAKQTVSAEVDKMEEKHLRMLNLKDCRVKGGKAVQVKRLESEVLDTQRALAAKIPYSELKHDALGKAGSVGRGAVRGATTMLRLTAFVVLLLLPHPRARGDEGLGTVAAAGAVHAFADVDQLLRLAPDSAVDIIVPADESDVNGAAHSSSGKQEGLTSTSVVEYIAAGKSLSIRIEEMDRDTMPPAVTAWLRQAELSLGKMVSAHIYVRLASRHADARQARGSVRCHRAAADGPKGLVGMWREHQQQQRVPRAELALRTSPLHSRWRRTRRNGGTGRLSPPHALPASRDARRQRDGKAAHSKAGAFKCCWRDA